MTSPFPSWRDCTWTWCLRGQHTIENLGAGQLTFPNMPQTGACLLFHQALLLSPRSKAEQREEEFSAGAQSRGECRCAQLKHSMLKTQEVRVSPWPAHECRSAASDAAGTCPRPFAGHRMSSKQHDIPFTYRVVDGECGNIKPMSWSPGTWLWNWLLFTSIVALSNVLTSLALVSLAMKWR